MAIKLYIDQGHNPQNPNAGAEGNGLREQDLVYAIGIELAALLEENPNFEVRLSRPTPETSLGSTNAQSLAARVNDANSWGADFFISLHANASTITSASGSEAFVYSADSPAYELSEEILESLSEATGLADRGVFVRPSLYVLRRTNMPATLLELGFITNPTDAALMRDNPALFAQGIYNGIVDYFDA
ncbi:MAG: N-acetylmuramoyl-L-alanine amidase [Clostridia bacterium]|nr:N-acetylmuramoyl-L-alanine amidase [Clostridia bacterium]